ncbi:MAG: hypothetical protein A2046_00195 [Bacteroidetes bacterium GWA2_30_7]|nr:MAG: hypothetical protein A2046_00195 [Bacteroidetes bacterium GWA2_30_7]
MFLIKFILITFLVIYVIGFLFKLWIKMFLKKAVKNMNNQSQPIKKEGEVTVEYKNDNKKFKSDDGEYVDYEEVK